MRSNIFTIAAIAIVSYAAFDLVHEALGHGVAALLVPDVKPAAISAVALQSRGAESRVVSASGSAANLIAGVLALLGLSFARRLTAGVYFLWLFAAANLMDVGGYLFISGVTDCGDCRLGAFVGDARELRRLAWSAYVAGGLLLVAASALNPISPKLIVFSGLGAGFGAPIGLLRVPALAKNESRSAPPLPRSRVWLAASVVVAALFVGVLGRGISF